MRIPPSENSEKRVFLVPYAVPVERLSAHDAPALMVYRITSMPRKRSVQLGMTIDLTGRTQMRKI